VFPKYCQQPRVKVLVLTWWEASFKMVNGSHCIN
jgi:hypothetical protein